MTSTNHLPEDDLSLFALQLLPEAEMQAAAQHLRDCAICRSRLGEIHGEMAVYAMTAETKAPPAEARERFLRQVAKEKKMFVESKPEPVGEIAGSASEIAGNTRETAGSSRETAEPVLFPRSTRGIELPEERRPSRVATIMAWTGWAVAATVATVAGLQYDQRKLDEQNLATEASIVHQTTVQSEQSKELMKTLTDVNAMQVSLHVPLTVGALPKLDPEAHATYVPRDGSLVFVASHLDPLQPAKTYELWLLPAQAGQAPIPAGLFKPDLNGDATVVMPKLPKGITAKGFGVTVENDGGSDKPTPPIVLAGM